MPQTVNFAGKAFAVPVDTLTWRDDAEAATHYVYRGASFSFLNHTKYLADHCQSSSVAGEIGSCVICCVAWCIVYTRKLPLCFVLIYKGVECRRKLLPHLVLQSFSPK